MNSFETLTVADRFSLTLDGLCRAVAARIAPGMAGWAMQAAMIVLVWGKIRRIEGKVQRLLARFRAGRLWVRTAPLVSRSSGGGTVKLPRRPTAKLPRRFGWLLAMVPYEAANFSSQLRHLLGDPEMVAFLKASAKARRVLAPLCRMLAIEAQVLEVLAPAAVVSVTAPPGSGSADACPPVVAGRGRGLGARSGSPAYRSAQSPPRPRCRHGPA